MEDPVLRPQVSELPQPQGTAEHLFPKPEEVLVPHPQLSSTWTPTCPHFSVVIALSSPCIHSFTIHWADMYPLPPGAPEWGQKRVLSELPVPALRACNPEVEENSVCKHVNKLIIDLNKKAGRDSVPWQRWSGEASRRL